MSTVSELVTAIAIAGNLERKHVDRCARTLINAGILPKSTGRAVARVDARGSLALLVAASATQRPTDADDVVRKFFALPHAKSTFEADGARILNAFITADFNAEFAPGIKCIGQIEAIVLDPLRAQARLEWHTHPERAYLYYAETPDTAGREALRASVRADQSIRAEIVIPDVVMYSLGCGLSGLTREEWVKRLKTPSRARRQAKK